MVDAAGASPGAAGRRPARAEGLFASARPSSHAVLYARLALGAAFLSAVAARFGFWEGSPSLARFDKFQKYAAEVNSFMPASTHSFLAWAATAAELALGLALVAGFQPRRTALASSALLAFFGVAMAISFGVKEPLDYSVFSASAAALLLAREGARVS